jgi:hypothetical protein
MPTASRINAFKLTAGKAYLLKEPIWAAPHDATETTSSRIPTATMFISWPYLNETKLFANIPTDKLAKLDGRLYDFAIWNETLPVGCRRFYRVVAEHLEGAAEEIVVR